MGEFDDHNIHCDEHIKRYIVADDLPEKVREKLKKHIREHKSKMIEAQVELMQNQTYEK